MPRVRPQQTDQHPASRDTLSERGWPLHTPRWLQLYKYKCIEVEAAVRG